MAGWIEARSPYAGGLRGQYEDAMWSEKLRRGLPWDQDRELRRNFRHMIAYAIDSPWTKDLDDAISIGPFQAGGVQEYVHVHITDITRFLDEDMEGPEFRFPLPKVVTNYLCTGTARFSADKS